MRQGLWLAAALAAGAAGGFLRSQYERDHFVVEKTTVFTKKVRQPRTVVFLTDLHDKEFGEGNRCLLDAIKKLQPDFVLIGGDTMVVKPDKAKLETTKRLLKGLHQICPVYYGNGNHEQRLQKERKLYGDLYDRFEKLLKQCGVVYLSDKSVNVGEDIRISGLNIEKNYYRDWIPGKMTQKYIQKHLGEADRDRFQILLAHSPLFFDAYTGWGADLTLSGHFHGGTIRIPVLGGVMTPQYQFCLPCCAGTFEKNNQYLIVGRGLGTHSINIRIYNKPQVVAVKLMPSGS